MKMWRLPAVYTVIMLIWALRPEELAGSVTLIVFSIAVILFSTLLDLAEYSVLERGK